MFERHGRVIPILALATADSLWGTGFFFGKVALGLAIRIQSLSCARCYGKAPLEWQAVHGTQRDGRKIHVKHQNHRVSFVPLFFGTAPPPLSTLLPFRRISS